MITGLYGIENSNRNVDDHWTKNCFNSSFPTSLAAYMLDYKISAIYMCLEKDGDKGVSLKHKTISISEAFNSKNLASKDLWYLFETVYDPYKKYSYDKLDGIDLVIATSSGQVRPLEIKLTAYPDNTTASKEESQWGAEMVIRSATTMYCALGIFDSIRNRKAQVRDIFENDCSSIADWRSDYEVSHKFASIAADFSRFQCEYFSEQKPVLMQVLWKTKGKSPILAKDAFQVIFWSDFAFAKMMLEKCYPLKDTMSRPMRAVAKMIRAIWELCKSGRITLSLIYREMTYDQQNDKEFSIPGSEWRKKFVKDLDLTHFSLSKKILKEIIAKGYIQKLQPERRLDQTLYFTYSE